MTEGLDELEWRMWELLTDGAKVTGNEPQDRELDRVMTEIAALRAPEGMLPVRARTPRRKRPKPREDAASNAPRHEFYIGGLRIVVHGGQAPRQKLAADGYDGL